MNVLESSFSFLCEVGTMLSTPVESWDQVGNGVDICEVLVDECANSASSDDDVARMRVTIFLTLDRAGRVKAEVQEVKAWDHLEVDNTAKADALTACDTSGTADIELTRSEARDAHTHSVSDAPVQRGYKHTAVSGECESEEGVYTACDDVADQKSADVIMTDT